MGEKSKFIPSSVIYFALWPWVSHLNGYFTGSQAPRVSYLGFMLHDYCLEILHVFFPLKLCFIGEVWWDNGTWFGTWHLGGSSSCSFPRTALAETLSAASRCLEPHLPSWPRLVMIMLSFFIPPGISILVQRGCSLHLVDFQLGATQNHKQRIYY